MVVLREEISCQGSVGQSHAKTARFDQAISGGDIPGNELSNLRRGGGGRGDRVDISTISVISESCTSGDIGPLLAA